MDSRILNMPQYLLDEADKLGEEFVTNTEGEEDFAKYLITHGSPELVSGLKDLWRRRDEAETIGVDT